MTGVQRTRRTLANCGLAGGPRVQPGASELDEHRTDILAEFSR